MNFGRRPLAEARALTIRLSLLRDESIRLTPTASQRWPFRRWSNAVAFAGEWESGELATQSWCQDLGPHWRTVFEAPVERALALEVSSGIFGNFMASSALCGTGGSYKTLA